MLLGSQYLYHGLAKRGACNCKPSDQRGLPLLGPLVTCSLIDCGLQKDLAVGQNQRYHVGLGAPPILVYFSQDWDVHWGYKALTHCHLT